MPSPVPCCVAVLVALLPSAAALGQPKPSVDKSFDVQLFQSAVGPGSFLTVETGDVPAHKQFGLGLIFNYQKDPFSIYTVDSNNQLTNPTEAVRNQISSELVGAIGLLDRFQLGIAVPLTLFMDGDGFTTAGQPMGSTSGHGIGDIRLEGKARIGTAGPDDEMVFAVAPGVTLPTGNNQQFMGDETVTGRLRFIGELRRGDLRIGANVGALFRKPSKIFAASVSQQLMYGVAAAYQFQKQVGALLEVSGRSGIGTGDWSCGDGKNHPCLDANPVEIDAAMRVGVTSMVAVTFGGGAGLVKGIGSPEVRGFLGAAWTPDFRDRDHDGVYDIDDKCPDQAEDRDGYKDQDGCPEPDNDGDGILDEQDKCPNDAEDFDQFEDEDGCPEPDNDKDGIPDINDACPNAPEDGKGKRPTDGCPSSAEDGDGDGVPDVKDKCPDDPEDRDGFEDDDGCPDPDNDNDGIPDNFDQCPNDAEDADGFEDDDGCPEPDNDKDGIPDAQDKCPLKPETLNGKNDDDGCPDSGAAIVRLAAGKIESDERVGFASKGGKIELKENGLLVVHLVSLVMKGHPEIGKLRIEVRAEGISKEETQKRADAVRDALVGRGIDAGRLSPVGMGAGGARTEFLIEQTIEPKKKVPASAPAAPQDNPSGTGGGQ